MSEGAYWYLWGLLRSDDIYLYLRVPTGVCGEILVSEGAK